MSSVGGSYRDERFEGVVRVSMCSSSERRFEDPNSFEIPNARPPTVTINQKNPGGNGGIGIPGIWANIKGVLTRVISGFLILSFAFPTPGFLTFMNQDPCQHVPLVGLGESH
jgi:hypothetical protein